MFDGLNAIPWCNLTHAYGSAEEVPMWLRQLACSDPRINKQAINHLHGSICHQGWICPATAYAVSYLLELLEEPGVQVKKEILELLEDIADAEQDLEEERWRKNMKVPSWNVPAHIPFKNARLEVGKGLFTYLALLNESTDPNVSRQAAVLIREFATLTPDLQARLDAVEQQEPSSPQYDSIERELPRIRYDAFRGHLRDIFREEFSQRYPTHIYRLGGTLSGDLVEVNERLVFRIPNSPSAVAALKRECAFLELLRERLPLPVPNPWYVNLESNELGRIFMGYPRFPGVPLYKEMLESIESKETVETLAHQIASFLYTLHETPLADLSHIALPVIHERKKYEFLYTELRLNLFFSLGLDICEEIAVSFETFLDTPQNFTFSPVLVHGNFGPQRILYNAQKCSIAGITGFTQIGLGDPASDIAALLGPRGYGRDFIESFERMYPDFQALRERIEFYVNASVLEGALRQRERQQLEDIARRLTFYRL